MTELLLSAGALTRALANILLINDPYSKWTNGKVLFYSDGVVLSLYACDDYVACLDSVLLDPRSIHMKPIGFILNNDDVESLYTLTKGIKDLKTKPGYVRIVDQEESKTGGIVTAQNPDDEETDPISFTNRDEGSKVYEVLAGFFIFDAIQPSPSRVIAVRQERLKFVHRVKTPVKEAPVDILFAKGVNGQERIILRIGPTFRAVIADTNRDIAREAIAKTDTNPEDCLW